MNPYTGLVFPKFHIKVDHAFDTVKEHKDTTPAAWLKRAGFLQTPTNSRSQLQGLEQLSKSARAKPKIYSSDINSKLAKTKKTKSPLKTNSPHKNRQLSSSTKKTKEYTQHATNRNKKRKTILS